MTGTVDLHMITHQLPIVFVRGEHIGIDADGISFFGQCANNVIGLVTVYL